MKTRIKKIDNEKEEVAEIYIHENNSSIGTLINYIENELYKEIIISCYKKDKLFKIRSSDIYYVDTEKNHLIIHTKKEVYEYRRKLYELEKMLPSQFIRISKSTILNLEKVLVYNPMLNGLMEVKLKNLETTYISRKYLKEVRASIKGGRE